VKNSIKEPIAAEKAARTRLNIPIYKDPVLPLQWWKIIKADWKIIFERNPAAGNWLEVLFCYPGWQALILHRIAHQLWLRKILLLPSLIAHFARFLTGVEIHPGASIGQGAFIDSGTGVTIGETAIVGDYCWIYQDVTLGGTGDRNCKRHPTLGNNVILGAGAKILGNIYIGDRVTIGASSVVLNDVPADCKVFGIPGRIVATKDNSVNFLKTDLKSNSLQKLLNRIEILEKRLTNLSR